MALHQPDNFVDINRANGEFRIPVYQAVPEQAFPDDPSDWIVFGQGIGEVGQSQKRIIGNLADGFQRRVIGYESRLGAQTRNPTKDAVEIGRSTHLSVVESVTNEPYSVVGHSLFGLTAGAVLEREQGQITDLKLISPATVASEDIVSTEWRFVMREHTLEERAAGFKRGEIDWKRNTLALLSRFAVVNLGLETARGVTNPIRSMKAGKDLAKDMMPGIRHAFDAFAILANVSTVPELEQAEKDGTKVSIVVGGQDPVFPAQRLRNATSNMNARVHEITDGRGQGHSNMSTLSGERQLDVVSALPLSF